MRFAGGLLVLVRKARVDCIGLGTRVALSNSKTNRNFNSKSISQTNTVEREVQFDARLTAIASVFTWTYTGIWLTRGLMDSVLNQWQPLVIFTRDICSKSKTGRKLGVLISCEDVGGRAVNISNSGSWGPRFKPRPWRCFLRQGT